MSSARFTPLLFLAAALQISTGSLIAQDISVSLGENRKEVLQPSAQITLPVLVDMTNADTLDLASLQLRLTWDTAVVGYGSWSAGVFGSIAAHEDAVAGGPVQAHRLSPTQIACVSPRSCSWNRLCTPNKSVSARTMCAPVSFESRK